MCVCAYVLNVCTVYVCVDVLYTVCGHTVQNLVAHTSNLSLGLHVILNTVGASMEVGFSSDHISRSGKSLGVEHTWKGRYGSYMVHVHTCVEISGQE